MYSHITKGAGAGGRDAELMAALKLLLDRLNSGQIPINKSVLEQLQRGGDGGDTTTSTLTNVNYGDSVSVIFFNRSCINYQMFNDYRHCLSIIVQI